MAVTTVTLSYTARLNLHFMLGQQRGNLDDIRACWELQDAVQLSRQEQDAIRYRSVEANGQSRAEWDGVLGLEARDFEFTREQRERMRNVVKTWPGGFSSADRLWLEPLLAQLPEPAESNGDKLEKSAGGVH